jgi:hypothetical protein
MLWWHAELLTVPACLVDAEDSSELRHAIETLPLARVRAPLSLVDALFRRSEPYTARRALAVLDDALAASTAPLAAIVARLTMLAAHPDPLLRREALQ